MQPIFFSSDIDTIGEWIKRHNIEFFTSCFDIESLNKELDRTSSYIIIADYDSVAQDINKLITSNSIPKNLIILEKAPEITTGKNLITHGIKAYGNSRMLATHYNQMIKTVEESKIWTYPELTIALAKNIKKDILNEDALKLIQNRLAPKEIEVVNHILNGLTNLAIASKLSITTRTVKAHISSIFSKLHVNDRLALVLLLK
ncbi:MAG: helix-turn-helix transcriptional regulator [Campylobacterota bacterium]|nr:helix-turn-helix transcriptional regulator [Campylobacterota bacterium]